ncbi:aminopeptidase N-like [Temnothorax nylanderi]|uniref:aminopeptidase N-like n=1 Tax=Temnothorax nylanderi TaxID=102681 RepID=UPI003A839C19
MGIIGARRTFPCWDETAFKATFSISIEHNSERKVLSNMPVLMTERRKHNTRKMTKFHKTPSIPPYYLIAIVVSNHRLNPVKNKKINFHSIRYQPQFHLKYASMIIERVTLHFESKWRRCEGLAKLNHVAIPGSSQEGMIKLHFVFYRETLIIYEEKFDPVIRKINVARLVAHAIAHQYLDNLFGFSLLSQPVCLREGILTLFAVDTINKIYPEFRIWDLFVVQVQQESFRLDTDSIMKPLMLEANSATINSPLFFSCYIKAPALLRMLQHALGYDVFWNGIKIFLNNRENKSSLNFDDLWTAMQVALNNSNSIYKFNIKDMMNTWTQLKHYPVINVTKFGLVNVKIFNNNALTVNIPVTFTTQDHCNFNDTSPYITPLWLYTASIIHPSNVSGWIIINMQQTGYYRVNYDAVYWDRIVNYLTSDEYTKIHVLNRAQIIDDAFYFLMNDQLPLSTFLELTKYLQRETDFIAWYPMIKALEYMSGFFLFEKSADIKIHMRDILHEILINITYTEKRNEKPNDLIKCLRQEAAKWACLFGHSTCKAAAVSKLKRHLNNTERLLPWWKEWAYCNGLANNYNIRRDVFDTWMTKADNKLLEYLPCSASSYIIIDYLNIILDKLNICDLKMPDSKRLRMHRKDLVKSFFLTVAKNAKDNKVLEHILKNFDKMIRDENDVRVALVNIINNVQSKEQLDKVLEFVKFKRKAIGKVIEINPEWDPEYQEAMKEGHEILNHYKWVNVWDEALLAAEQKIKSRLSEIANQLNYFQYLVRN